MGIIRPVPIDELTRVVIGLCIKINSKIGPGCFERVYGEILYHELVKSGYKVLRQIILPISYETLYIRKGYKIDLLIEDKLVVELKSHHPVAPVFFNQVHTYLSLLNLKHGMLVNFKVTRMKEGI